MLKQNYSLIPTNFLLNPVTSKNNSLNYLRFYFIRSWSYEKKYKDWAKKTGREVRD